jgi:hypothetical protein
VEPIEKARPTEFSGKRATPGFQAAAEHAQHMRCDMRKRILSYVPAVSILIACPAAFTEHAAARSENAAEITSGFRCFLPNFQGTGSVVGVSNNHSVVKKENGTTMLRCSAKGMQNNTGKALQYFNFPCWTFMGKTFDSHLAISKNGNATMICLIHPDQQSGTE